MENRDRNSKNSSMKVIFLDHDGVICLSNNWGSRYRKQRKFYHSGNPRPFMSEIPVDLRFDNFDRKSVEMLNSIVDETGAEIVVSSDWRFHATLDELGEYYISQGIIKKPIAVTTNKLPADCKFFDSKTDLEESRSYEILDFISTHKEIEKWVAIDDLNMSERFGSNGEYLWGLKNFVHTRRANEGIKQLSIKGKVMKFLL